MEGSCASLTSKQLDVDEVRAALGPTFNRVSSLVAELLVEPRGLEAVSQQDHLQATTQLSLGFGNLQKGFA